MTASATDARDAAPPARPARLLSGVDTVCELLVARRHRDQALSPGEQLGLVAQLGEQADRLGGCRRRVVLEGRRLQRRPPLQVSERTLAGAETFTEGGAAAAAGRLDAREEPIEGALADQLHRPVTVEAVVVVVLEGQDQRDAHDRPHRHLG
jgi:hypothetical protein